MALGMPQIAGSLAALGRSVHCLTKEFAMNENRKTKADAGAKLPENTATACSEFDDVEHVLEHISSPYRWEILALSRSKPDKPGKSECIRE
jgi:hypothetical protein